MEPQSRKIQSVMTIAVSSTISLAVFIVAMLYFPLEFLFVSIVAILLILRSIEKEIDAMDQNRYDPVFKK
jgi:Flp pilus assembly protein TadB